jgi:hypothetical protein
MTKTDFAANYIGRKQLAQDLGERLRGRAYSEHTLIRWERDGKGPPAMRPVPALRGERAKETARVRRDPADAGRRTRSQFL